MKKKIIISIVVGSILCLGIVGGVVTSIINKNNVKNANKELQERIDFVNNTYTDMKETKSIFHINLNELNEKHESFELQIEKIENLIDTSSSESNTDFLDLEEAYYIFETDLEYLNEKYESFDSQLTDITSELSNPNLDFNQLSNDTLEALNSWSDDKTEISNLFNPLNEKADSIENQIKSFDIVE